MEGPEGAIKDLIEKAIDECHDLELLDLVYKLLMIEKEK